MSCKKKKKLLTLFLFLLLLIQFIPGKRVQADEEADPKKLQTLAVPFFSIKLVPPANQPAGYDINYFDIKVTPGMKQDLEFYLASTAKTDQKIKISPTNASNSGGNIIATEVKEGPDASNKQPFTSFGFDKTTLNLKPGEIKKVKISFTVPDQPFDGLKIGGINLETSLTTTSGAKDNKNQKAGLKFVNKYSMGIQVVLSETEKLVLADLRVKEISPLSYKTAPAVGVKIQNPNLQYMDDLSIDATVTRLANKKDQHNRKVNGYGFAPTSNYVYKIEWNPKEKMEAGKYRLKLKAKAKQNHLSLTKAQQKQQEWQITKDFTITKSQADNINRKNPNYKPDYRWLYIVIAILGVILILFLFWLVFTIGRKHTNKNVQIK